MKAEGVSLPARGRDPARRRPAADARRRAGGQGSTVPKLPPPVELRRRRPRAAAPGRRLLPRDAQGPRPRPSRTSRSAGSTTRRWSTRFQLGYANRTLGLPPAGARTARPALEIRQPAPAARHPARERPRALQRLPGHPGLRRAGATSSRSTAARSRHDLRERHAPTTSTCPARTAASSTSTPSVERRRSSSARR